jgi:DNA repair photolyase
MPASLFTTPLTITSQFSFCGLPLRLDSYAGCAFCCTFCFARFRGGNSFVDVVRAADSATLGRIFRYVFEVDDAGGGMVRQFLRRRVPIHFGGMSDPFQPAELRYRVTESFLQTLARYHYPTVLSTRSKMVACEPYISLLKELGNVVVQFSFCSSRDEVAAQFEPYSTSPSKLLGVMSFLAREGIAVTCRWQPYIPGVSEPGEEFASRMSSVGCRHVALEHLKIPMERSHPLWEKLTKSAGRDFYREYKSLNALRDGREYVLPPLAKLPTIREVARAVRARGMTFGAADNEFQYLSDTGCCCSGVDQFPGFKNWFRCQIGCAVRESLGKRITYGSVSRKWAPIGSLDRFLNSRSRLSVRTGLSGSVHDHLRARWNNPKAPGSPASFYGVVPSAEITSAGNKVYVWDSKILAALGDLKSSAGGP